MEIIDGRFMRTRTGKSPKATLGSWTNPGPDRGRLCAQLLTREIPRSYQGTKPGIKALMRRYWTTMNSEQGWKYSKQGWHLGWVPSYVVLFRIRSGTVP